MNKHLFYLVFLFFSTSGILVHELFAQPEYLKILKTPPIAVGFHTGSYFDINPIISPNGQMILFTRVGHPDNIGGVQDLGDIWCKKRRFDGTWGEAFHLGRSINNSNLNFVAGFDVNSKLIYLNNSYRLADSLKSTLYYTQYSNGIFTVPHKFEIDGLENMPAPLLITATSTDKYLILSLAASKTDLRENLYISFKIDGEWSVPIPMNEEINSAEREVFPYMANDSTLYFCSNGLAGYGGMDAYVTQKQSTDWKNITLPYNLGPKFNSIGEETNVSISQDMELYYQQELRSGASTIRTLKGISLEFDILGSIQNQKGKPIAGAVDLHDLDDYNNEVRCHANNLGRFNTKIHQRTGIKFIAHASGYLPQIIVTTNHQLSSNEPLNLEFTLQKIVLGQSFPLLDISFSEDGRDLLQSSLLKLEVVEEALEQNPDIGAIITVYGYRSDDPKENKRIVEQETKSLRNALENKGAKMSHILLVPYFQLPKEKQQTENAFGSYIEIVFVKK